MSRLRLLHTADWQLGMRRAFLDEDARARYADARFEALAALVRLARDHHVDAVVVAGDVFETNHVERRTVVRALELLRAAPCPVLLLPGNHDPRDPGSVFDRADFVRACPPQVRVLGDEPVRPAPGVEIVGVPWPSKKPGRDLVAEALERLAPDAGTVRILVGHGGADVLAPGGDDPARIRVAALEAALADGRIAYAALGDRHSTTSVGSSGRIWYAGTPEPTDFDEADPGNVLLVDVAADACAVRPLRVGTWAFRREVLDLPRQDAVPALRAWLDDVPDKRRTILRLALRGTVSLRDRLEIDLELDRARDAFGCLDRDGGREDLAVLPEDDELGDLGLSGFARDALDQLVDDAPGDRDAEEALALLYRLAGGLERGAA